MTIRAQFYSGSCLAICVGASGSIEVRYPGVDLIPPIIDEDTASIVYVYLDFKESIINNIALGGSYYSSYNKEAKASNLQVLMSVIKTLTEALKHEDSVPNSSSSFTVAKSQLKILTRVDRITPRLYMDIFGSEVISSVGSSEPEMVAFIAAIAAPQTCVLLVEGNSSAAKEVLGSNLNKWRDVALAYSTNNSVITPHPVSLASLVCTCDSLESYGMTFQEFCSLQKIANDRFNHINSLSKKPMDHRDYAAMHALLCLRYANAYLYSSLDTYSYSYHLELIANSGNHSLESNTPDIQGCEYGRSGDSENIIASIGGARCTTPYSIVGLMSYPSDFDKGMFKTVCKLPTINKAFPKQIVEAKLEHDSFAGTLDYRVARSISIVLKCHILKKFLDDSKLTDRLGVDAGVLTYQQLVNKGPVRKKVLQGLYTATKRLKGVRDLGKGKEIVVTAADLARLEAVCNYFESIEQSKLLNCWAFNQTEALAMLFPEYCLTEKKLYGNLSVFNDSKAAILHMLKSNLENWGSPSVRVVKTDSDLYSTRNSYSSELVIPFVLSELFCNGTINNVEYVQRVFGRDSIVSMDRIKAVIPYIDLWDTLIDSAIPREVKSIISRQRPLQDSYMAFPELWTKEFISSISLEYLTNNASDSMYDLLKHQISTKLRTMLGIYHRLGYSAISVYSDKVSGKCKDVSACSALEIINVYIMSDVDYRGNTYKTDGSIIFTPEMAPLSSSAGASAYSVSSSGHYVLDQRLLRVLLNMPVEDFLEGPERVKLAECIRYALPSIARIRTSNGAPVMYLEQLEELVAKLEK